jgi:uncharacterized protein YuzE
MIEKYSRGIDLWEYDFETDTLFFRDCSLKYHSSIDLGDLMIEVDENGMPIGMELLDASTNFGISKIKLRNIKSIKSTVNISDTNIEVTIKVLVEIRNAKVEKVSVSQGVNDINLQPGQTAMAC